MPTKFRGGVGRAVMSGQVRSPCGVQLVSHRAPPQVADRGTPPRYGWYRGNEIPGADQNQSRSHRNSRRGLETGAVRFRGREGRDTPVPVGEGVLERALTDGQQATARTSLVGNQAEMSRNATGSMEEEESTRRESTDDVVFIGTEQNTGETTPMRSFGTGTTSDTTKARKELTGKKDLVTRMEDIFKQKRQETLGRPGRSGSLSEATNKKRKASDVSPMGTGYQGAYKLRESPEVFTLMEAISAVEKNTKIFGRTIITEWLKKHRYEPAEKCELDYANSRVRDLEALIAANTYSQDTSEDKEEMMHLKDEQEKLRMENKRLPEENKSLRAQMAQTSEITIKERPSIGDIETIDNFKLAALERWNDSLFRNVEVKVGNLLATEDNVVKVILVEHDDREISRSIQRLYRDRYPELKEMEGDFVTLEQVSRLRIKGETKTFQRKVIKINIGTDEKSVWDSLTRLRKETKDDERVAIHHVNCMRNHNLRKMVACIFHEGKSKVYIYTTQSREQKERGTEDRTTRKRNTYALIIDSKKEEYRETVRKIKATISNERAKNAIREVRSTREGKVIIKLDKDEAALKSLKDKLNGVTNDQDKKLFRIRSVGEKLEMETIHIRGIDAATDIEKLRSAIEEKVGRLDQNEIQLGQLRQNRGETQAATIRMVKKKAEEILKEKTIQVGMVRAQVERRVEVLRCFNCLGYNHKASECTKEKRNKSCYRCGGEDHMAKDCKSTVEFCVVCRSAGHRAGSGKCRLFKQALAAAKKEHKSRGGQKISRCQTCKVDGHKEETMACPKHRDALRDKTEKRKRISSERMEEDDHLPISFKIDVAKRLPNPPFPRGGWKWDEDKRDGLADCLHRRLLGSDLLTAEDLTEAIGKACDESLLRKKGNYAGRRPVYWWTLEVKASWKASTESKRKLMRANRNRAIRRAKAKAWESLVESVDQDPWGRAYQIATRKMRIDVLPTEGEVARAVQKLFPVRPEIRWAIPEVETPRAFTTEELRTAAQRLRSGKAAGPNGIPAEVVRLAVEVSAGTVLRVMNDSLAERKFPERWKRARLVLIPKDGRDSEDNLKLRPICLLDCLGKLLEQLLKARLLEELEERGGFSEHQYGFREGRSKLDAMEEAIKFAHFACSGFWGRKDLCALTTVDVENAFNTAPWDKIVNALTGRNISPGLTAMVMSYLEGRSLIVEDDQEIAVTCGVPQGSVLEPILWNVMYDAVLRLDLPVGARTLAFADDLALLTTARTEDELMRLTNAALSEIARWMENAELKLATEKTESVLLVGYRRPGAIQFSIGDEVIRPQKSIRYLGVYLDQQMSFTPHIQQTVARTERTIAMLGRLMPNPGGPASATRKLLNSVATSILLYGSEVWVDGLRFQQNKKLLVAVQRRSLLKVISGYRTVSAEAAQVIAGVPPIILLAEEGASLRRGTDRRVARSRIMAGALIPDVKTWVNRGHGTVNFHLTQALSEHGCFGSFLFRIGKSDSDACWYCGEKDDPKHTLFYCVRWEKERLKVMKATAQWPVLDNFTDLMLQGPDEWEAVKRMARNILKKKEADERRLEEGRQEADPPVPVDVEARERAPLDGQPATVQIPPVGDQAGLSQITGMTSLDTEPIQRKDKILRTPPRPRACSVGEIPGYLEKMMAREDDMPGSKRRRGADGKGEPISEVNDGRNKEDIFNILKELKDCIKNDDVQETVVAMALPQGIETEQTRKILECIFYNTNCRIIVKDSDKKNTKDRDRKSGQAIIIDGSSDTFADTLKKIKEVVKDEDQLERIQKVQRTAKEDLMIKIAGEAKPIKDQIEEALQGQKIRTVGEAKQKTLHIRDINETCKEEEIRKILNAR
ncbi:hypothetical protein TcasGA2_TC031704 [Tribolium castaneum]|uniref:Reverse transcriptase domain-containing protein n=1 Tax=Tribolium castaneum TaxID=7070 RepID=A0A139W9I2_TRICA|nr:hypothetical protein TcasGA2_TC031704 [Tribolium castaneum]